MHKTLSQMREQIRDRSRQVLAPPSREERERRRGMDRVPRLRMETSKLLADHQIGLERLGIYQSLKDKLAARTGARSVEKLRNYTRAVCRSIERESS